MRSIATISLVREQQSRFFLYGRAHVPLESFVVSKELASFRREMRPTPRSPTMAGNENLHAAVPLHILEISPRVSIRPSEPSGSFLDRPELIYRLQEGDSALPDDELVVHLKPGLRFHLKPHRFTSLCSNKHIGDVDYYHDSLIGASRMIGAYEVPGKALAASREGRYHLVEQVSLEAELTQGEAIT